MTPFALYHAAALLLLGIGLYGILHRSSLVGMLICVELLLNGAGLAIVAATQLTPPSDPVLGQLASLLVMGLAAAEATLVLAILVVVAKRFKTVGTEDVATLKG